MKIKGQIFECDGKHFKVYRISLNRESTKTFVHFHRVHSPSSPRLYGKEVYYTEELSTFLKEYISINDAPPPLPDTLR
jgi:hypothetical protein